jgi:hypothetical protein
MNIPDKGPGNGLPVTIIRPNGPFQDIATASIVNVIRIFTIRRALRRFFPDREWRYREVMVGVGAIRALQVGSDYAYWTREPLGHAQRVVDGIESVVKSLRERYAALTKGRKGTSE